MSTHALSQLLVHTLVSGLRRKAITACSKYATTYRVMGPPYPGPFSFRYHSWTKDMHDAEEGIIVGQKCAQVGYTEFCLNKTFYSIDMQGVSVLYLLPASTPDASDFSTSRFDPALEMSPHLRELFSDVSNIGHKRAGVANLYIRGSRSRSQLKSIPVGLVILDEVDEMKQENIPLVFERTSGQVEKQIIMVSTPTINDYGINTYFLASSQDHYYFKCPRCSRYTELLFPDCLVITSDDHRDRKIEQSHYICKECKGLLEQNQKVEWLHLDNCKWVPTYSDRASRGFYVNQMYSSTIKPHELAISYCKSMENPADEQEFFNSKLGLPHTPKGASITDTDIMQCIKQYKQGMQPGFITMGVDVGRWLHGEITRWMGNTADPDPNVSHIPQLLKQVKVANFEELDTYMKQYNIAFCVIDANPERRKALEFAQRFWGRVKLCFYGMGITGKSIHVHAPEEHTITVDRTSWIDTALNRFRTHNIVLPSDIDDEYKRHIKAPVRIYEKDSNGNPVAKYISTGDDHYAHGRTYNEISLKLAAAIGRSQNLSGII